MPAYSRMPWRWCLAGVVALGLLHGCGGTPAPIPDPKPEPGVEGVPLVHEWSRWPAGSQGVIGFGLATAHGDGRLYVGDRRGWIRALDPRDGTTLWHRSTEWPLSAGPVVGNGLLLLGDRKGRIYALDPDSGNDLWQATLSSEVLAPPRQVRGVVVARSADGRVFGLDAETGRRLWIFERTLPPLTLHGAGAPAVAGGNAVVGLENGRLVALRVEDGDVLWEREVQEQRGVSDLERMADIAADPVIDRGLALAVAYQGAVAAFRMVDGAEVWRREIPSHRGLASADEHVYVADDDGRVWALDRENGATAWRQDALEGLALTGPVVFGEYLVVADGAGHLNWLRRRDGAFVERTPVSSVPIHRPPLLADGRLYVQDARGRLFAYSIR